MLNCPYNVRLHLVRRFRSLNTIYVENINWQLLLTNTLLRFWPPIASKLQNHKEPFSTYSHQAAEERQLVLDNDLFNLKRGGDGAW